MAENIQVRVARDVLKQLAKGKYIPAKGLYILPMDNGSTDVKNRCETETRQQYRNRILKHGCYVCALGSLFLSAIHKAKIEPPTGVNYFIGGLGKPLQQVFSSDEMRTIETHFELYNWSLEEIMDNIIDNGKFVPSYTFRN